MRPRHRSPSSASSHTSLQYQKMDFSIMMEPSYSVSLQHSCVISLLTVVNRTFYCNCKKRDIDRIPLNTPQPLSRSGGRTFLCRRAEPQRVPLKFVSLSLQIAITIVLVLSHPPPAPTSRREEGQETLMWVTRPSHCTCFQPTARDKYSQ